MNETLMNNRLPSIGEITGAWHQLAQNAQKFNEMVATEAAIAQTPKELIWTLNKAKLYRYVPVKPPEERHPVPLLMVFAIMNRPHVLDLRPGHSFVEFMLEQGYDLYLLDWGAPGPEDKEMKFDDYTLNYLPRVVRKLKAVSGSHQFSLLGWCLGALICTIYAALRSEEGLRNLILLTAPLDFSDKKSSGFIRWTSSPSFKPERIVEAFGNTPGEMIDSGAKMLKPVENYVGTYTMLWDNIENVSRTDAWHAMNTWVRDTIPMAGAAYQQLINEFYKENKLMNGTLTIRGEQVDLSRITASLFNVIAEADHITPPCQSERIMEMVGTEDKELFRVQGGHIGIMAGRGAEKKTWPHIDEWLSQRSRS